MSESTSRKPAAMWSAVASPVVVRLVAYMQISTDNGDDSVNVYGDLVSL